MEKDKAIKGRNTGTCIGVAGALLCGFLLFGCADELTEQNALTPPFIASDLLVKDTTVYATGSSTFRVYVPMNGPVNLVGRSSNYVAQAAMQFFPSLFPDRDTIDVLSADLTLRCVSWFGDSTGTFAFTVHKITREWSPSTMNWDSVGPGFYESTTRGEYSGTISADTQSVVVSLDTAMVREWLRPNTITSHGILFVPTTASTVVRGLHAFDFDSTHFYPTLKVVARGPSGAVDTSSYNFGIDTFVGNIDNLNSNQELLYLQSGVVYRSIIRFDLAGIPRGAIINTADLLLDRDLFSSRLTRFSGDSSAVAHMLFSADSSVFQARTAAGRLISDTLSTYSFDIRNTAQVWLKESNYGLILRMPSLSEFSSFNLLTFFNERATDPAVRPRIRIVYTVQKNQE